MLHFYSYVDIIYKLVLFHSHTVQHTHVFKYTMHRLRTTQKHGHDFIVSTAKSNLALSVSVAVLVAVIPVAISTTKTADERVQDFVLEFCNKTVDQRYGLVQNFKDKNLNI